MHDNWPEYLYYSKARDVQLHAVLRNRIMRHHQPRSRLLSLYHGQPSNALEQKLSNLLDHFKTHGLNPQDMGITGSFLIGAQNPSSDIDLVFYQRDTFFKARDIIKQLLSKGILHTLDAALWQDAYDRRSCSLSFEEFLWHEKRKYNKAAIQHTKFDISLITPTEKKEPSRYQKHGKLHLRSRVLDDRYSFDYPARYRLDHPFIKEVISYTATYAGQAQKGELVEVRGQMEIATDGKQRIVVGTDREACGEYIKVLASP